MMGGDSEQREARVGRRAWTLTLGCQTCVVLSFSRCSTREADLTSEQEMK